MPSLHPAPLKKGDTVQIISTARKISEPEIAFAVNFLQDKGFEVSFGEHLFAEHNQFAGTTQQRVSDFQKAIENPKVKAILCARGGYGTVKLLNHINFEPLVKNPKWIIGYSDVTALHAHINSNFKIATLHASMPINFETNTPEALKTLVNTLEGKAETLEFAPDHGQINGEAKGILFGGNLSVLYSLLGSNSFPKIEGGILFLEDLDEYLYHVDRMITALDRSGIFKTIRGLVVGSFTKMHDNTVPFGSTAKEIILSTVEPYAFPVVFNCPAGHIDDNRALIFGKMITLRATDIENSITYGSTQ
ncbi:MAG: S66 peptidase family protein [Luteibaculaceae bacterium]